MKGLLTTTKDLRTVKIVGAAAIGAVVGLAGTALLLNSLAFGIFGAVGGALAAMIAVLAEAERSEA